MKILFVLEYYYPHIGGVEIVFKNLCERLAKNNEVTVITSKLEGMGNEEEINGVKIKRVKVPRKFGRYFFTFLAVWKVWKESKNYDLIHTTTYNAAFPAWLAGKLRGRKVILTVHEVWVGKWKELTDFPFWKRWIHEVLEKAIYLLKFDFYIGVSNSTVKELLRIKIPKDKTKAILNGFDNESFVSSEKKNFDGFTILGYGRPGISKGFRYLVKAFPLIKEKIKDAKLILILSTGKDYLKERRYIENLKIEGMELLEPVKYSELPNYVNSADVVVVPSLSEGFGYTCVEACSLGKKVVASDIASLPEVISGEGKLVKTKSPEAIAKGVIDIYNGNFDSFGEKSFSWEENVKEHEKVYEWVLKQ